MAKTAHEVQEWLGYLTVPELEYLKQVARDAKGGSRFVNIGAGGGTSGLAFMESNPDILVWTIDPQKESSPYGCLEGEEAVLLAAGLIPAERYEQIHGLSQEVAKTWDKGKVEVVFVDGSHEYPDIVADIQGWLDNMARDGLLILHDYNKIGWYRRDHPAETEGLSDADVADLAKAYLGVDRAVKELLEGIYVKVAEIDTIIAFKKHKIPKQKKSVSESS